MKTWMVVIIIGAVTIMFSSLITTTTSTSSNVKSGCHDTCGNITVPYPFGLHDSNCAINESFLLTCNSTISNSPPRLVFGDDIQILNISVDNGTIIATINTAYGCYNESGALETSSDQDINLDFGPFRFSDTRNKLTAFGCDTIAFMSSDKGNFSSGCISLCDSVPTNFTDGGEDSCSGIGCCQTSIPRSLKTLNISLPSPNNHTLVWDFNPCDYGFLADTMSLDISNWQLSDGPDKIRAVEAVIEWVIEEKTCDEARLNSSTYACTDNADCYYSENGKGYRCRCKQGFEGNPYLLSTQGCQNIDECKEDRKRYPCYGTCTDTIGDYTCKCPFGKHGDGKTGCEGGRITITIPGAVTLSMIIGLLTLYAWKQRRKQMNFSKNGGMVLKRQKILRIFKETELVKATKNYDHNNLLGEGGFAYVYKGLLADNTLVAVKMPKDQNKHKNVTNDLGKTRINQEFEQEIGIVSQVKHKNVVRLLGLCVETKVPLLVYEYISNGTLYEHIHGKGSHILNTWKNRLRIAAETALALDYFHSLVDPPIIHGDVKSKNILLDENYKAKVSDFGASVLISSVASIWKSPGDQSEREIRGTFGYLDPEYMSTGILTEKTDVYSFGIVLIELLTGKKPGFPVITSDNNTIDITRYFVSLMRNNGLIEAVSFEVANEDEKEEIQEVAEIAERCICYSGVERPTMKQVSEELNKLEKLHDGWRTKQNNEEQPFIPQSSSLSLFEHPTRPTFDIENNIHTIQYWTK